jgi:hypothetical protein
VWITTIQQSVDRSFTPLVCCSLLLEISHFSLFLRKAAREPKNPPAAVNTQIVAVTAISLVVIIFYSPNSKLFLLILRNNGLKTLAKLREYLSFCGLIPLQDAGTHCFGNHTFC